MAKKYSIADVAKLAGVSKAAVSYALNGVNKISDKTKEAIFAAIKELEYEPNLAARCLSNGKSNLVGVILPITEMGDVASDLLEKNPFFSEFISGLENVLSQKGYDILLSGMNSKLTYVNWIERRRLDGIILLGTYPLTIYDEIKKLEIPTVLTDVYEEYAKDFHCIRVDDEYGSYLATKHLLSLGHTRIGFASGAIKTSKVNYYRFEGYKKALMEANLPVSDDLVFETNVTFEGGLMVAEHILKEKIDIDALVVVADIMAIGIMKYYQENGKSIPNDLSVVGFDDIRYASYCSPSLTTIRQDIVKKGMISAELIIKELESGVNTKESVIITPKLIVRGSTTKNKKVAVL
jgi:LacI family transcriptional regulator